MKADYLALRNAKNHVHSYNEESQDLMQRHTEAIDCLNCEAFLQMGIDAFDWIIRADRVIRLAIYRGDREFDPTTEAALHELCKNWLLPCKFAESWIAIQQQRGYEISNLSQFRDSVAEMTAIVEANQGGAEVLSGAMARLRDQAVKEQRDGQTAEFI
jgi:hypothetical protein